MQREQREQIVQKLLQDPELTNKSHFPTWAAYLIGAILIAIILFFGIGAIRRANRSA